MAIIATRNVRGSRMQKVPRNWRATESYTVTGTTSKSQAIDKIVSDYFTHPDNAALKLNPPIADRLGVDAFRVTADYTFIAFFTGGEPLDQPTEFYGDIATITEPIDRDISGNPIVNSAGDPIEPGPTRGANVFVLICERNIPAFAVAQGLLFTDSVNLNTVVLPGAGTWEPGQGYCRKYAPISKWKYGDPYVRVRGEFEFRRGRNPWDFHPKDQGRNSWYSDSGAKTGSIVHPTKGDPGIDIALDGTGKPINTQWKVMKDAATQEIVAPTANPSLPAGLFVDPTRSTADAKFLEWLTIFGTDWSDLPF